MKSEHADEITLLRLAFPKEGVAVSEYWAQHVLHCPQCSEDILNMREMSAIFNYLDKAPHKLGGYVSKGTQVSPYGTSGEAYSYDIPAAAFTGSDSDMSSDLGLTPDFMPGLDMDGLGEGASLEISEDDEPGLDSDVGNEIEHDFGDE